MNSTTRKLSLSTVLGIAMAVATSGCGGVSEPSHDTTNDTQSVNTHDAKTPVEQNSSGPVSEDAPNQNEQSSDTSVQGQLDHDPIADSGATEKVSESIYEDDERQFVRSYVPKTDLEQKVSQVFVGIHKMRVAQLIEPRLDPRECLGSVDPEPDPRAVPPEGAITRFCSGTLIDDDLFLTAGHCCEVYICDEEEATDDNGRPGTHKHWKVKPCESQEDWLAFAARTSVSFNYELKDAYTAPPPPKGMFNENDESSIDYLAEEMRYGIARVVEQRYESLYASIGVLDYMILELDKKPGADNESIGKATLAKTVPDVGKTLVVIGHPDKQPKQVSVGQRLHDPDPLVDKGLRAERRLQAPGNFDHSADTLANNSGSGVLDAETGDLVGVHVRSGYPDDQNEDTDFDERGNNAMRIDFLLKHSMTLCEIYNGEHEDNLSCPEKL